MNNIRRSQYVLIRQRIVMCAAIFILAVASIIFGAAFAADTAEVFGIFGLNAMTVMLFIPIFIISTGYSERILMYEIMAGFRPHQIILGKALAFLPTVIAFIASAAVICMVHDSSEETIHRVMIYSIICIRMMLCIVFLSPVFKVMGFAPLCSLFLMLFGSSDMEEMMHSPLSLMGFVQCSMLTGDISAEYMTKVIVSAVVSCVLYYIIGYTTLKMKINLEPPQLS